MNDEAKMLRLFADGTRLRILMLLAERELCVCQIMGVLGVSQPLVSRNLNLLNDAGLLSERKNGKLVYYRIRSGLSGFGADLLGLLQRHLQDDLQLRQDLESLQECEAYQRKTGRCDMKTLKEFMQGRLRKAGRKGAR